MTVGREDAAAVGVVEEHELAGERVLVGRDLGAEDAEFGPAVALGHVAEHLVVGAVFLDHVDHVLDQARLTDPFGDHPRRLAGPRRGEGVADRSGTHVAGHAFRERR